MNKAIELWRDYRKSAFETNQPLAQMQERECSLAFYAGLQAAFVVMSHISNHASSEEIGAGQLEEFRTEIAAAAAAGNLDRSDGKS
jgi:hypothetical protein